MSLLNTPVTEQLGIEVPLLCGAMYPCSNPELVAAASEAGGIGVLQPLSMVYVHGHEFRAGLKLIRSLTAKPVGMNVIVERSSKVYQERMQRYVDTGPRGGRPLLRHLAGQSPLGGGEGARGGRPRLPRRDRPPLGG